MYAPFADNQERFVFQFIRQINRPQLQAAQPSGHLYLLQGVKHIAKLVHGFLVIGIRLNSPETVQLLIVIILDFLADRSQQAIAFAGFVLSATFVTSGRFENRPFGDLIDFPTFQHPLQFPIPNITGDGRNDAQNDYS